NPLLVLGQHPLLFGSHNRRYGEHQTDPQQSTPQTHANLPFLKQHEIPTLTGSCLFQPTKQPDRLLPTFPTNHRIGLERSTYSRSRLVTEQRTEIEFG